MITQSNTVRTGLLGVALLFAVLALCAAGIGGTVAEETGNSAATTAVENVDQGETFGSIQAAVDNASAGDTIEVPSGTYTEAVTVDVPGLTLAGPNAGTPGTGARTTEAVIDQTGAPDSGAALSIAADGVTVDGLQVETAGQDGVALPRAVDDVTVTNTRITRVDGGTFGSANGPRAAGNGINLQFSDSTGETSSNVVISDNLISNVTTPDTEARTTAVGVQVLPRGNDVEGLTITDNTVTDIEPGASANQTERARGVVLGTQLTNGVGVVTRPTIADNEFENIRAQTARAIALFESSTDPALGPTNFTITRNTFDNLTATNGFQGFAGALYVGAYKNLGADHEFIENDVLSGAVGRFGDLNNLDEFIAEADPLDARNNWWGDASGPSGAGSGSGQPAFPDGTEPPLNTSNPELAVQFTPFLESPSDEAVVSIQREVDAAEPGDTIEVPAGRYNENVVLDKPGLTLTSATTAVSTSQSGGPVISGNAQTSNAAITITADDVTVDGVEVDTDTRDGILVSEPVDNVTITNTQITRVAGEIGGKAAGNGIQLFYDGSEQTSTDITITDNRISNVSTPDAAVEADAIGVQVLPRGNDIEGLTITGNTITGIDPGNSTDARADGRAISIGTQLTNGSGVVSGLVVRNNQITNVSGDSVRSIALFESSTDPAVGTQDFTIQRNTFDNLSASGSFGAVALYVGAYKSLGDTHAFTENDILDGSVVRFADTSDPVGFIEDPATDALNAQNNWWGNASGPSGAGDGAGQPVIPDPEQFGIQDSEIAVEFTPFLEAPVEDAFLSIQDEIDAASPGDTVQVPAGRYEESVVVDKPLTLAGPNAGTPATGDRGDEALVAGAGPAQSNAAITVTADDVTIDGLQVDTETRDGITVASPVDNLTVANTRITGVAGELGGKAAGNGIDLIFDETEQTMSNVVIRDNLVSNVTTPDASVEADAIGVQVLPGGNDIEGLTITDNTFTDIAPGNSTNDQAGSRAIVVDTQLTNGSGVVSDLTITNNDITNVSGEAVRSIALFESMTDPAVGPQNFTISQNTFDDLSASGSFPAVAFYVGAYKDLGADHAFTQNNIRDGSVVRFADTSDPVQFIQDADALNARNNWWGNATGPSGAGDGAGQPVIPDPAQFGIQDPEVAVEFTPFRGTPALDILGNGNFATDTNGDGNLDDVRGDGELNILDVQSLFNQLDNPLVQRYPGAFDFSSASAPDVVSELDVQGLFNQLETQG